MGCVCPAIRQGVHVPAPLHTALFSLPSSSSPAAPAYPSPLGHVPITASFFLPSSSIHIFFTLTTRPSHRLRHIEPTRSSHPFPILDASPLHHALTLSPCRAPAVACTEPLKDLYTSEIAFRRFTAPSLKGRLLPILSHPFVKAHKVRASHLSFDTPLTRPSTSNQMTLVTIASEQWLMMYRDDWVVARERHDYGEFFCDSVQTARPCTHTTPPLPLPLHPSTRHRTSCLCACTIPTSAVLASQAGSRQRGHDGTQRSLKFLLYPAGHSLILKGFT